MKEKNRAIVASVSASFIGMMWLVVSAVLFTGMIAEFGFRDAAKVKAIMTIQPLVAVIMALATGPISKRVSKKLLLAVACALVAVDAVIYSNFTNANGYGLLYLGAVFSGIVSGIISGVPNTLVYKYAENFAERGKLSGYNNGFLQGGALVMSLVGGNLGAAFGWRAAYYLWYLGVAAFVIVVALCPSDKPVKGAAAASTGFSLKDIPARVWVMCLHFMLFFVCCYTYSVYCSRFVQEIMPGASNMAGYASALLTISAVASSMTYGKYAPKLGRYFMPFFCLLLALGYVLIALVPGSIAVLFLAAVMIGAGKGASIPYCISHAAEISPKPLMPNVIAFIMASMSFGMFVSQYITSWIAGMLGDAGSNYNIFVATAIVAVIAMVFGGILYWKGDKTEQKA